MSKPHIKLNTGICPTPPEGATKWSPIFRDTSYEQNEIIQGDVQWDVYHLQDTSNGYWKLGTEFDVYAIIWYFD